MASLKESLLARQHEAADAMELSSDHIGNGCTAFSFSSNSAAEAAAEGSWTPFDSSRVNQHANANRVPLNTLPAECGFSGPDENVSKSPHVGASVVSPSGSWKLNAPPSKSSPLVVRYSTADAW